MQLIQKQLSLTHYLSWIRNHPGQCRLCAFGHVVQFGEAKFDLVEIQKRYMELSFSYSIVFQYDNHPSTQKLSLARESVEAVRSIFVLNNHFRPFLSACDVITLSMLEQVYFSPSHNSFSASNFSFDIFQNTLFYFFHFELRYFIRQLRNIFILIATLRNHFFFLFNRFGLRIFTFFFLMLDFFFISESFYESLRNHL